MLCTNAGRGFLFNNYAAINVFFGLTALSILCNFACVFISMYCMIFGPELAAASSRTLSLSP